MPNYDKETTKILEDAKIIDRNPNKAVISKEEIKNLPTEYKRKKARKLIKTETKEVMKQAVKAEVEKIPLKHLAVLTEWIKHGNATKAYMKIYQVKNDGVAGVKGSLIIRKYEHIIRRALLDKAGATLKFIVDGLVEMTGAKQSKYSKKRGILTFPDNKTRIKAYELLAEILGEVKKGRGSGTPGLNIGNIIIVKDKEKGVFSIGEEEITEAQVV